MLALVTKLVILSICKNQREYFKILITKAYQNYSIKKINKYLLLQITIMRPRNKLISLLIRSKYLPELKAMVTFITTTNTKITVTKNMEESNQTMKMVIY